MKNVQTTISKLTQNHSVTENGAHILYMYNEVEKYIENAVSFISEGVKHNTILLVIESEEILSKIKEQLTRDGFQADDFNQLPFLVTDEFYSNGEEFDAIKAGNKLTSILKPFIDQGYAIRSWGKVPLPDHGSGLKQIIAYESDSEEFIVNQNMISVCTYHDLSTPAYLQNELLKTHTHIMTDEMYSLSPFYNQKHLHALSDERLQKLQRIEQQNIELKTKNSHLAFENNLVKLKNDYIKQNETKLRTIINELPIPIIIRRGSKVLFSNEWARELIVGSEQAELLQSFCQKHDQNLKTSTSSKKLEHQFIYNNEAKFFLVYSINIFFEKEDAFLHSFIDITQEKENERLIIRSEKMNIAGELAASIAHEIRNPLTAIKGFFDLLKRGGDHSNESYYWIIEKELSRIEQISGELLTLAKPHSENKKSVNIVHLLEEVKFLLTSQANMKSIEMATQVANEDIYIICEETKIKQVFINLIKNAIDAMESNGKIRVQIKKQDDAIQIQVIDQGKGIPKELLTRIGEPFYTTKEKGTGLGLMVCYEIIKQHEGTIQVESTEGVGTTFTITLPIDPLHNRYLTPIGHNQV